MTDTTDAVVGTVGGLLALGIMANVAGKMMGKPMKVKPMKMKKQNHSNKMKSGKSIW